MGVEEGGAVWDIRPHLGHTNPLAREGRTLCPRGHSQLMPEAFRQDYAKVWADQLAGRAAAKRAQDEGQQTDHPWNPGDWWDRVHALMVSYGLKRSWVTRTVNDDAVELRDGVAEFINVDLKEHRIPLTIVSAGNNNTELLLGNLFQRKNMK